MTYADEDAFLGLHHVQLAIPTGTEDVCREFWRDILGFTELEKPPVLAARGGCWFRGGGFEVHLGVEQDFRPASKAHPGILVNGLDVIAARLVEHGVDVEWDDNFPGMRRFYANDPFGNRLELLEQVRQVPAPVLDRKMVVSDLESIHDVVCLPALPGV